MSSRELGPEWVLSRFISPTAGHQDEISELVVVARRLWPRVQALAHREQQEKTSDEALALATDICVLQSVAKTIQRANRKNWRIKNTDRKSTRLNSSHITISYAVFCLKKKRQI